MELHIYVNNASLFKNINTPTYMRNNQKIKILRVSVQINTVIPEMKLHVSDFTRQALQRNIFFLKGESSLKSWL